MDNTFHYNEIQQEASPEHTNNHDIVCMAQANQLLANGFLGYEAAAYSTVYKKDGKINYYITSREDSIVKFIKESCTDNVYYVPIRYNNKRYDLIDYSQKELNELFRYETAQKLYYDYPEKLFDALEDLTAAPCSNSAHSILEMIAENLTNSFDSNYLNIFSSMLDILLQGRKINKETYYIFAEWLNKEYEKSAVEEITVSYYSRNYNGFAYEKTDGSVGYFSDAIYHRTLEKHVDYITRGYIVTPILSVSYHADSMERLLECKKEFIETLKFYFDTYFFALIKILYSLPSDISREKYHFYEEQIAQSNSKYAINAFQYYGFLWNIL